MKINLGHYLTLFTSFTACSTIVYKLYFYKCMRNKHRQKRDEDLKT